MPQFTVFSLFQNLIRRCIFIFVLVFIHKSISKITLNFKSNGIFKDAPPNVFNVYISCQTLPLLLLHFLKLFHPQLQATLELMATYFQFIFQASSSISITSTSSISIPTNSTYSSLTFFLVSFSFNLFWFFINVLGKIVCYECIM